MDQQMDMAWTYLSQKLTSEAQKCFAVSTSRINSDFVYFLYHHLNHQADAIRVALLGPTEADSDTNVYLKLEGSRRWRRN